MEILRNSVGEIVIDYCKIVDEGDTERAKEYLKAWLAKGAEKKNIIWTLQYGFRRSKKLIDFTKKLLDEINSCNS